MMARKVMDCRLTPSLSGCTLVIAGEEDEVVRAAVDHAMKVHGEKDTPEFRERVRASLRDEETYRPLAAPRPEEATAPH